MSEARFLEDICTHPDDDTPRTIFADWLEDGRPIDGTRTVTPESPQGESDLARAEFIRAQITAAQLPTADPQRVTLEERAVELLEAHREEWTQSLRDIVPSRNVNNFTFERGFPTQVSLTIDDFLHHAPALFAAAPLQEIDLRLRISFREQRQRDLEQFVASPNLSQLKTLNLGSNDIFSGEMAALMTCPYLTRLTTLNLRNTGIRQSELAALARSAHLPRLETLLLGYNNAIGPSAVVALVASPHLTRLTTLDLRNCHIGPTAVEELAASQFLTRLTTLNLASDDIGPSGVAALAGSPHLTNLTVLDLSGNLIDNAGVADLAAMLARREAQGLPHLEIIGVHIPLARQAERPPGGMGR